MWGLGSLSDTVTLGCFGKGRRPAGECRPRARMHAHTGPHSCPRAAQAGPMNAGRQQPRHPGSPGCVADGDGWVHGKALSVARAACPGQALAGSPRACSHIYPGSPPTSTYSVVAAEAAPPRNGSVPRSQRRAQVPLAHSTVRSRAMLEGGGSTLTCHDVFGRDFQRQLTWSVPTQ